MDKTAAFKDDLAFRFAPIINAKLGAHASAGFTTFDTADM
ncbi:hypothetical protein HaLaN_26375, partial [Haematococcus lacustris]